MTWEGSCLQQSQQTFSVKDQTVTVSCFAPPTVPVNPSILP